MGKSRTQMNLSVEERRLIHKLLGDSNRKLASGIAEALLSSATEVEEWSSIIRPGVVCLVEDQEKRQFGIVVIDMDKEAIVWKQHIDHHLICERRRRWILVLQTGYRKLCLNFIDDDEADRFNMVFYGLFPELQSFEGKIPYYVSARGKVIKNQANNIRTTLSHTDLDKCNVASIKEDNVRKFVQVARLSNNVLQDPTKANEVYDFYEKNKDELDEIFDDKEPFSTYSKIHNLDLSSIETQSKSNSKLEHMYFHLPLPIFSKHQDASLSGIPKPLDMSLPLAGAHSGNITTIRPHLDENKGSGSSGSLTPSFSGSNHSSSSEVPLPKQLYCGPPSNYSSSDQDLEHSSLEDNPEFRKNSKGTNQKDLDTRMTSAPPLPQRKTVLKGSPKVPRKLTTLTRTRQHLQHSYSNDIDDSEFESETFPKLKYTLAEPKVPVERHDCYETPQQPTRHFIPSNVTSPSFQNVYKDLQNKPIEDTQKLTKVKKQPSKAVPNIEYDEAFQPGNNPKLTQYDFENSSTFLSNRRGEDACFYSPTSTPRSLSTILEIDSNKYKNKSTTLPRLPTEESNFDCMRSKLPSTTLSTQQKYISLPPTPPPLSIPQPSQTFEFRDGQTNSASERRESLLDQIKNPGFNLRKIERSKTRDSRHKNSSMTDGGGSMSSVLAGALKNIRGFKGNSRLYSLEDENPYRCWDSSDSN